jgi:hypothetical protein
MDVIQNQHRRPSKGRRKRVFEKGTGQWASLEQKRRGYAWQVKKCDHVVHYMIRVFTESRDPVGEGPFPLGEGVTERKLSAKASH